MYLDGEMSYCVAVGTAYDTSAYKCNKSNVSWRHNCSAQLSIYSNKMQDLNKMKMKMSLVFLLFSLFFFFSLFVFDCIFETVMRTKCETNQRLHSTMKNIEEDIKIQPDEKQTHQRGNNRQYRWVDGLVGFCSFQCFFCTFKCVIPLYVTTTNSFSSILQCAIQFLVLFFIDCKNMHGMYWSHCTYIFEFGFNIGSSFIKFRIFFLSSSHLFISVSFTFWLLFSSSFRLLPKHFAYYYLVIFLFTWFRSSYRIRSDLSSWKWKKRLKTSLSWKQ